VFAVDRDRTLMPLADYYAWRAEVLEWIAVEHPERLDWALQRFAAIYIDGAGASFLFGSAGRCEPVTATVTPGADGTPWQAHGPPGELSSSTPVPLRT
jgi:hypothetical protein